MSEPVIVPGCGCPRCGYVMNRVSSIGSGPVPQPKPGDISVCIMCASALCFTEQLELRVALDGDLRKLDTGGLVEIMKAQGAILELQSRRGGGRRS